MRRLALLLALASNATLGTAQTPPAQVPATPPAAADPLTPLDFLTGTWLARTNTPAGSSGAAVTGAYTFHRDLAGHALVRTGSLDTCQGPQAFDCAHHDQLTIFADPNGLGSVHKSALFALYLDSEGHVIYYTVSTPDPQTAIFSSQGPPSLPRFRLTYHLEGAGPTAVMTGKFQFAPPGSDDYHSYLEWSGTRQ